MRLGPAFWCTFGLLLSGCARPQSPPEGALTPTPDDGVIVIALIDSGTSPYYDVFHVADQRAFVQAVPIAFEDVHFELPGSDDPVDRDRPQWEALVPKQLYHFAGTRLFAMSFEDASRERHFVRDASRHGAATSYLAARTAPDSVILSLQVDLDGCLSASCAFSPTIADAMEWAAEQEWIDVISVSLGVPANAPDDPAVHDEMRRYLEGSRKAASRGAIIVSAAGNEPTPSVSDYFSGPPWFVSVGGFEPATQGEQLIASKTVDVVANYTEFAPESGRGELGWRQGTSFGTPIVAGTLADALRLIYIEDPELRETELVRGALNASGLSFDVTDWDPSPPGREPLPLDIVRSASLPILVQPQMGWGYVNGSLAPEIARRVLENDLAIPPGKEQAAVFQAEWQRAREEYWARYS